MVVREGRNSRGGSSSMRLVNGECEARTIHKQVTRGMSTRTTRTIMYSTRFLLVKQRKANMDRR